MPWKRDGSNTKLRAMCHWLMKFYTLMMGSLTTYYLDLSIKYVVVPHHGPLSLYIKLLRARQLQNWISISLNPAFECFSRALVFTWSRLLVSV